MGLRIEFFLYSILVMSFFTMPAFAEENFVEPTVRVETDKLEYEIGEIVTISGFVEAKKMPVLAMRIYDPDGSIMSANNVEIEEDGTFSKIISLDSVLYDKKGTYSVTIDYGKIKTETFFDLGTQEIEDANEIIEEENPGAGQRPLPASASVRGKPRGAETPPGTPDPPPTLQPSRRALLPGVPHRAPIPPCPRVGPGVPRPRDRLRFHYPHCRR